MRSPFRYFVRARREEWPHGQVAEGYADEDAAMAHAEQLAHAEAHSDVLVILHDARGYLVRLLKGVQWFCEEQLNAQFPGWSVEQRAEPPVEVSSEAA